MSLIIGRQIGPDLFILSDTHLTDPLRSGPVNLQGVVKTRVFSDGICVSFAGKLHWAEEGFRELSSLSAEELTGFRVATVLGRIHSESSHATDFLIGVAAPAPQLIEIKDGRVQEVMSSWLGSAPAFERFQGFATGAVAPIPQPSNTAAMGLYRLPERASGEVNPLYNQLLYALQLVIEDAGLPEVGGFVVPVGLHRGRFEYMDYAMVLTHPIQFDLMPREFAIPFGTAAEGGYAFNLMNGLVSSKAGLAVYALQGRYGVAFTPRGGFLRPVPFRDVSPLEFEEAVASQLGLEIRSSYTYPEEYCSRVMRLINEQDLDSALGEADKAIVRSPKSPEAYRCRGIVHANRGDLELALSDFGVVLGLEPENPGSWDNYGLVLVRMGRLREALDRFSEAVRITPTYLRGYQHRAMTARELGKLDQAIEDEQTLRSLTHE